ncbi:YncE family protein [Psychroflexus aestuariivivens]|uniref:YncE family protein n=1 Tax=Psychroflexus aestuariivivens TaxID=1795040 RepID=UPI000FDB7EB0|nr:DUF5074 domain-containing protein [Psychroflexus aestuariivivens]
MINKFKFFTLLLLSIFIVSCSDDDSIDDVSPEGDYQNGFFVLNEGSPVGSVSFMSSDFQELSNSIYENKNDALLGSYLQSIFFEDDRAYIISNGSNIITVVNRYTFELIDTIDSDLNIPMFGTTHNGKAYVVNIADFSTGADDYLAVIDLETLEVETTVEIGDFAEEIYEDNGMIYVQNTNYGIGNSVSKFDPNSNTFVQTLEVGEGLNSTDVENGKMFAATSEGLKIVDLNSFSIENTWELPNTLNSIQNVTVDDNAVFYTSGTSVYSTDLGAEDLSSEAILTYESNSDYGVFYGFKVEDSQIYIADAGAFTEAGTILVYDISGQLIADFTTDIGPNGFYFQ